jgi:hypothetical protein
MLDVKRRIGILYQIGLGVLVTVLRDTYVHLVVVVSYGGNQK